MPAVRERSDVVVYRDPAAHVSHPCVTRLRSGDLLVAFCESLPRRPILHPPADPRFVNLMARLCDGGQTWHQPRVVPGYEWTGMQCPGITQLSSGDVLLSQWQFGWVPLAAARRLAGRWVNEPTTLALPDGSIFVVYYAEDDAGVTFVLGSRRGL